jgi:hypothetical protein
MGLRVAIKSCNNAMHCGCVQMTDTVHLKMDTARAALRQHSGSVLGGRYESDVLLACVLDRLSQKNLSHGHRRLQSAQKVREPRPANLFIRKRNYHYNFYRASGSCEPAFVHTSEFRSAQSPSCHTNKKCDCRSSAVYFSGLRM